MTVNFNIQPAIGHRLEQAWLKQAKAYKITDEFDVIRYHEDLIKSNCDCGQHITKGYSVRHVKSGEQMFLGENCFEKIASLENVNKARKYKYKQVNNDDDEPLSIEQVKRKECFDYILTTCELWKAARSYLEYAGYSTGKYRGCIPTLFYMTRLEAYQVVKARFNCNTDEWLSEIFRQFEFDRVELTLEQKQKIKRSLISNIDRGEANLISFVDSLYD